MPTKSHWVTLGAGSLVLAPLVAAIADVLRMRAEEAGATTGIIDATSREQTSAMLASISSELSLYQAASWLALVAALVAVPAVAVTRRLTSERSPRWSLAALIIGCCLVIGEFVHLMGYYAWNQILASLPDRESAVTVGMATTDNTFGLVVFSPYLVGWLFFWPVAAIALYRARLIPRWALVLVLLAGLAMAVLGSSMVVSPVWAIVTALGLAPVLLARLRAARTDIPNRGMAQTSSAAAR